MTENTDQRIGLGACYKYALPAKTMLNITATATAGSVLVQIFTNTASAHKGVSHQLDAQFIVGAAPQPIERPQPGHYTLRVVGLDTDNAYRLAGTDLPLPAPVVEVKGFSL